MDSNNKIVNKWVLIYRDKPYFLIDKFYTDSDGVAINTCNVVETFDTERLLLARELQLATNMPLFTPSDYDRRVAELIHERYTYDAEAAMAAKHRRCYLGLCSTMEAEVLKVEAVEFEKYREKCKIQARLECGIK